ncbi:MAG TPA: argininosuccinate lyase [Thermodesulfobacteriota bacterium]
MSIQLRERVKLPPSELFVESYYRPAVGRSFQYLFEVETWIHLAHALMLGRRRIVSRGDVRRILEALLELSEAGPEALEVDFTQEDLYSYVERWLVRRLGPEVGGRLHTGRSRNDLHTTSWRMALRASVLETLSALADLRETVIRLAGKHLDTVMPGYTHTQHAQPITLAYYLLSVADLLARDHRRLRAALTETDRCPLGSGALTTTAFPIDRVWTARALGFAGVVEVGYDGVSARDDVHQTCAALAILMTNLSRVAFDLQAWNTAEFRFVEIGDQHASVSSIMPQKKNPAALEHIKAATGMVTGALVAALACTKNTSLSDVNDGVTAINEPVLDAAMRTRRVLRLAAEVLEALTVNADVMLRAAQVGYGTATELADVIVRETGLSFRMAHNIVAGVVREAIEAGKTAVEITAADLERMSQKLFGQPLGISEKAVAGALDPVRNVRIRTVLGGPAPANVRRMLAARRRDLARDRADLGRTAARIAKARERVFALAAREAAGADA